MARRKVKLAWIANDSARRASLKKRRLGLLKKVSELTTLCGVDACVIIYSPDKTEPVVWPSHDVMQQQLARFQSMPESERQKKMTNQDTYLREKVTKAQEQLTQCQRRNKEVEMTHLMHQINQGKELDELNLSELHGLIWFVEEKINQIRKRIEFFLQVPFAPAGAPYHPHLPLPPQGPAVNETARIGSGSAGHGGDGRTHTEPSLWDQWLIDMMNHNEHKSAGSSRIRSDVGLPYHPFAGSAADDPGMPGHSFAGSSSGAAHTGLPPMSFRQQGAGASDMGLSRASSIGGSGFGPLGSDIGLGLHPLSGDVRRSSAGSELGLPHFRSLGGSSSGAGSDIGLPFDGKTWPNNFSP
ncbi:PREDICTED: MADS-box transcription factor PHERES 1 [Theobroma cacao]|uniref:MADS-box transcription factor PHERES 1 n=2 Tax=Theobroma cacao TaxID=3641 RepID=A0AB32WCH0_THECC|nr:PREDICTED: MADS-box transcription factor PHERES 1 [Theobroma cacao]EOY08515.1 AGAMOUS-like 48, putative [Theobroma cacao]